MQSNRIFIGGTLVTCLAALSGCASWTPSQPAQRTVSTLDAGFTGRSTAPLASYDATPIVELSGRMWPVIPNAYAPIETAEVRPGVPSSDTGVMSADRTPTKWREGMARSADTTTTTTTVRSEPLTPYAVGSSMSDTPSAATTITPARPAVASPTGTAVLEREDTARVIPEHAGTAGLPKVDPMRERAAGVVREADVASGNAGAVAPEVDARTGAHSDADTVTPAVPPEVR